MQSLDDDDDEADERSESGDEDDDDVDLVDSDDEPVVDVVLSRSMRSRLLDSLAMSKSICCCFTR